jgi:DNA polymerase III sliding clamp (beta) subunit (PCNA family)
MEIQFDRQDFINAVKWSTEIIDVKNDLATVRMDANDDGTVEFSSVSGEGERSITIPATITDFTDEPLELVAGALKKVPSQITSDSVVLTYSDKDRTQLSANVGLKLKLPIMSSQDRPLHDISSMDYVGVIAPADLFYVASRLAVVSDESVSDSRFRCLDFETQDDGHIKVVATDGFVFTTRLISYQPDADKDYEDRQFILPSSDIKKMSDASNASSVDVYVDDASILFSFDDGRTSRINKFLEEFLEYQVLVYGERENEESFDVSFEDLKDVVTRLGSWSSASEDNNVYFDVSSDTNEIKIHNSTNTWDTAIQFVGDISKDYHAVFRFNTLMRTLNTTDAETLRYRFIQDPEDVYGYAVIWNQIKNDGTVDDTVYLLSLPVPPNQL